MRSRISTAAGPAIEMPAPGRLAPGHKRLPRLDVPKVRFAPLLDHSSVWASNVGGIDRPTAFAVFILITTGNLVGCSTGRSIGLAPLRILSTYNAARSYSSG